MRSLKDERARAAIVERLKRLTPSHHRRWGKMESTKLLPHLADALRLALGEIESGEPSGLLRYPPIRFLAIHGLPWPKGVKAPAEVFHTSPSSWWYDDHRTLLALVDRFASTPADRLGRCHPLFGPLTARDWDVLMYRHLDHHLGQFGL